MKKYLILAAFAVLAVVGLVLTDNGQNLPRFLKADIMNGWCDPADPADPDCTQQSTPKPNGSTCAAPSECSSGLCTAGYCVPPTVTIPCGSSTCWGTDFCGDAATSRCCSAGQVYCPAQGACASSCTAPKKADGESCTADIDCLNGHCRLLAGGNVCGAETVTPLVGTKTAGQACAAASECASGLSCTGGVCTNPMNQNQGLNCVNSNTNQPTNPCPGNNGGPQFCPPAPTYACPTTNTNNTIVPKTAGQSCLINLECASGLVCEAGTCKVSTNTNVNNTIVPKTAGQSCLINLECAAPLVCDAGTCKTITNTNTCPSGQQRLCPNEPMRCVTTSAECGANTQQQACPMGLSRMCPNDPMKCVRTATECTTTTQQNQYDSNNQWNQNTYGAAPETMTQQDWFSGSKCGEKALNMDPFCYGNHPDAWNWKEGCVDSK
ncbi:hypothetical protein HZA38_05770, partial [Candidatus Peregrinibacteria bacterium]|nr:hypothetical protein [Candidatus Peregrinibacteria bacterium]